MIFFRRNTLEGWRSRVKESAWVGVLTRNESELSGLHHWVRECDAPQCHIGDAEQEETSLSYRGGQVRDMIPTHFVLWLIFN